MQYLNPTLQFAVAVAVFGEAFTLWHGVAFPLIWAGLGALFVGGAAAGLGGGQTRAEVGHEGGDLGVRG